MLDTHYQVREELKKRIRENYPGIVPSVNSEPSASYVLWMLGQIVEYQDQRRIDRWIGSAIGILHYIDLLSWEDVCEFRLPDQPENDDSHNNLNFYQYNREKILHTVSKKFLEIVPNSELGESLDHVLGLSEEIEEFSSQRLIDWQIGLIHGIVYSSGCCSWIELREYTWFDLDRPVASSI